MSIPTNDPVLDSISWGGWQWIGSGSLELTYYFDNDFSTWLSSEKQAYRDAFQAWANVAGFTIREVFTEADANFVAHVTSDSQMFGLTGTSGVLGFHDTPEDAAGTGVVHGYFNYQGYSLPESGWTYDPGGLVSGGYGFYTFLHELGHGLGFAHPHDTGGGSPLMPGVSSSGDTGTNDQNQSVYTIMSYLGGLVTSQDPEGNGIADYGYNHGVGAYDIALAQYYYGANMTHNSGNDVYVLTDQGAWLSIWDTGGTDTIFYGGSADAIINLNSALLDGSEFGGGYLSYLPDEGANSYFGGFTIAGDYVNSLADIGSETGVIIENATGGIGDDTLIGNGVRNRLLGRNGDDEAHGNGGNDVIAGGNGDDTIRGGAGNDVLRGNGDKDRLFGDSGTDNIRGGSGNDVIIGGTGDRDKMWGDGGIDAFVFSVGYGVDIIMDFEDDIDILRLNDNMWSGTLSQQDVLDQFATDIGDHIRLNFGNGNILIVRDVDDVADLANDILII